MEQFQTKQVSHIGGGNRLERLDGRFSPGDKVKLQTLVDIGDGEYRRQEFAMYEVTGSVSLPLLGSVCRLRRQ